MLQSVGDKNAFAGICTLWEYFSSSFIWILTVKMETRHPVKGSFGTEFPAICNHRNLVKNAFFGITTPHGKIVKLLFWKLLLPHRATLLCINSVKFGRRQSAKSYVIYQTKKFFCLPLKLSAPEAQRSWAWSVLRAVQHAPRTKRRGQFQASTQNVSFLQDFRPSVPSALEIFWQCAI